MAGISRWETGGIDGPGHNEPGRMNQGQKGRRQKLRGDLPAAGRRAARGMSDRNKGRGRTPVRPKASLTTVKPVPLNRLCPGAVVWAHVGFEDHTGEKARPAVVIEAGSQTVKVLPVTTSANRRFHPTKYVEITDLNGAGVTRPSGVALRPLEIDRIELIALVGELSDEDHEALFASPHFARATSSPMATGARPTEVHDHFDPSREASG